MKVKLRLLAVVAMFALLLVPVAVLAVVPSLPCTVDGHITISGVPAPAGTVVTAKIEGVSVGDPLSYTTLLGVSPHGPDYYIFIILHDPSHAGKMVVFYVNGIEAQSVAYGGEGAYIGDFDLAIGDTEAPTVTDNTPTGSNVPVDTLVTATFSEAMDPATITPASFTLAGSAVSGTVSYAPGTYTATFTPDADLEYSHTYTATLSTDITDGAVNPLASAKSWSFTTLTPAGWGKCGPIDLVIVLDITGSMGGALSTVKAEVPDIVDDAVIASGGDLRMGYITFDGGTLGVLGAGEQSFGEGAGTGNQDWVTVGNALTDDIATVMASIEATTIGYGANWPEASDEAKNTAVNNLPSGNRADPSGVVGTQYGDFTEPYRDGALKIVVLITDAPPGGFNDVWDTEDTEAMHTHAVTAANKGILVSDVYIGSDPDVAAVFKDDADTTGGAYIQTASGSGVGDAIADILAACGEGLKAEFSAAPRTGEASLRVRFTDQSTGCIDSWLWDFGDGNTSTSQNPSNIYRNPGSYDVSLTVTGCGTLGTDTETEIEYITVVAPKAGAGVLPPEPAKMGASNLFVNPEQVVPSQWLEISANIYNKGGTKGTRTVALVINGYMADSQTVGVSPGASQAVVFRVRADSEFLSGIYTGAGTYNVNVEGMEGQFFVLAQPEAPAPAPVAAGIGGPLGTGGIIAIIVIVIAIIVGLMFVLRKE